jgi:phosphopantothenoylcysteine decarboxylase/phosphopantothenate--cysteine ligase
MRILITHGPAYEPVDQVRRLTNFSTGELGTLLAENLVEAGHSVLCLRGESSSFAAPLGPVEVVPFGTNLEMEARLREIAVRDKVAVVFHAAALTDFRVREVLDGEGAPIRDEKISSREPILRLTLEPAPKVIAGLRRLFPAALLIGWKYESKGSLGDVIKKGRRQMEDHLTDACVLNGPAYGPGFGIISRGGEQEQAHLPDKPALCRFLVEWLERIPLLDGTPRPESFHALSSFVPLAPFL